MDCVPSPSPSPSRHRHHRHHHDHTSPPATPPSHMATRNSAAAGEQASPTGSGLGEDGLPKPAASLPPPPLFMKRGLAAAAELDERGGEGQTQSQAQALGAGADPHPRAPRTPLPAPGGERVERVVVADDPLSVEASSQWAQYWLDAELVEEIHKDVVRTHPDLQFFLDKEHGPGRYEALQRILFVYAKLNPGVRYVQGMNELVGTLYYVLAVQSPGGVSADGGTELGEGGALQGDDALFYGAENAESDAFVCFSNLMGEVRGRSEPPPTNPPPPPPDHPPTRSPPRPPTQAAGRVRGGLGQQCEWDPSQDEGSERPAPQT